MDVSESDIGHSDSEPVSSRVFDDKTRSDDLNRIGTDGVVKDKILSDTSKRLTLDINPNEAYSEDTDVIINNEGKQSDSRQNTHMRTTVKGIPQSSLYMVSRHLGNDRAEPISTVGYCKSRQK